MKKMNKKGFSLVELIVVVAIMGVLVGVLAPSLLRYVEKTRIQKDAAAVAEVSNAVVIAMADEAVFNATPNGSTVLIESGKAIDVTTTGTGADATKLEAELASTIGASGVTFSSTAAKSVTLTVNVNNGAVSISVTSPTTTDRTDWDRAVISSGVK